LALGYGGRWQLYGLENGRFIFISKKNSLSLIVSVEKIPTPNQIKTHH
jgi:hypothetical protein